MPQSRGIFYEVQSLVLCCHRRHRPLWDCGLCVKQILLGGKKRAHCAPWDFLLDKCAVYHSQPMVWCLWRMGHLHQCNINVNYRAILSPQTSEYLSGTKLGQSAHIYQGTTMLELLLRKLTWGWLDLSEFWQLLYRITPVSLSHRERACENKTLLA